MICWNIQFSLSYNFQQCIRQCFKVEIRFSFWSLFFQPNEEFSRLNEPLQTVVVNYCPTNYSVAPANDEEKLHSGKWKNRWKHLTGRKRNWKEISFKLFATGDFTWKKSTGKSRATKSGVVCPDHYPQTNDFEALWYEVARERRLFAVTRSLGCVFVQTLTHGHSYTKKIHAGRRRSTARSTCRMYANCVQRGEEGTTPWREAVSDRQSSPISLYSRIKDDIIFYGAITF